MKFAKIIWVSLLVAGTSGMSAKAAEITPHAAKYTLSLETLRVEKRATRAGGTMDLQFSRDCFHWWVDREMNFNIKYTDGRRTNLVVTERLRETLSGKLFWFWSRTTLNGQTTLIVAGSGVRPESNEMVDVEAPKPDPKDKGSAAAVTANAAGAKDKKTGTAVAAGPAKKDKKPDETAKKKQQRQRGVTINYDWPEDTDIEVAPGVMFPVAALRQQLDALAAGGLLRQQTIFDGSRKNGAARTVYNKVSPAAIVKAILPDGDSKLLNGNSWRFKADHYPLEGNKSSKPHKTVVQKLHVNGIVSEILMDMGPFSVAGRINWVKELPIPTCE